MFSIESANIVFHGRYLLNMSCQVFEVYKIYSFHLQEIIKVLLHLPGDAKSQLAEDATGTEAVPSPVTQVKEATLESDPATPSPLSPYPNVSVNLILNSHCTSEPVSPFLAHYSAIGISCSTQISNRRHPLCHQLWSLKARRRLTAQNYLLPLLDPDLCHLTLM